MSESKKITVKNISNMPVGLTCPEAHLHRIIEPGRSVKINEEILDTALTFIGVQQLFDLKFLAIPEKVERKIFEDQGILADIQPEDILDGAEILKTIETGSDIELKKILDSANSDRIAMIAQLAVHEAENLTFSKAELIQKYSNTDVGHARKLNEDAIEQEPSRDFVIS